MGVAGVLSGFVPRKLGDISTVPLYYIHSLILSFLPKYQLGCFQLGKGQDRGSHSVLGFLLL